MLELQKIMKSERKATPAERFFTRSPFSIVTVVARIKGYVSEEMLRNAAAKVQTSHFLLNVRIRDNHDHTHWFTFDEAQEIPIEVFDRSSDNDWIRVQLEASRIPFDFENRPAIRFLLVQAPDVCELIILCHHIICDGMSLAYLARDLMEHLGDPALDAEITPPPPAIDLDNLPRDVSQPKLVQFIIKRMNQKWAEDSAYFDNKDYQLLTKTYWDHYNHEFALVELSAKETSALVARCRAENVTVNTAITAAFSGAQSLVEGEKPYHARTVIATNLRDRLPNSPGEGMGFYAGAVDLKLKYNHKKRFWANARGFQKKIRAKLTNKNMFKDILNWLYLDPTIFEAMNFKKLGGLVPPDSSRYEKLSNFSKKEDVVLRLLKRDKLETLTRKHWGTAVTNLGRLDFPTQYGSLELDRLIFQPGGGIPLSNVNIVVGAATCAGKLSLLVEYTPNAVDPSTIEKIKEKALALMEL